jgi:FKBP-type peptidyl-prolyl cis-trans isomerase
VFDTTHEDNSIFTFEIGQGAVIKAWDIALRTMKVGKRVIVSSFWFGLIICNMIGILEH